MESKNKKNIDGAQVGYRFGLALNDIESKDFEAAQNHADWLKEHGFISQASALMEKIPESEIKSDQKCSHGSTTITTKKENQDPYGYWETETLVCDHCGTEVDQDRKYIITKPKPEPESEPEPPESETITPQQAKYWYAVAKKDISEGNIDGAYNLLKWFKEKNQDWYADLLEKALDKAIPKTPELEVKPESVNIAPTPEIPPEPETETEPEPETPENTPEPERIIEGILKARINKKLFRAWVDPIYTLIDEMKVNITKTGLTVKVVDPAHVAMMETTLDKKAFEDYKTKPFELGMDLEKLISFLKKGDQKKSAMVSVDYNGDRNKTIWSNGINERTITNIDTAGMDDPKVPVLNLPNIFTIDRKTLLEALKEGTEVSDFITLISDSDGVTIKAEGDTDNTKAFIPKELLPELDAREQHKSLFSLDYLVNIIKAIKTETVTLNMGTDYPLVIEWEMEGIKASYLLAPRIESE